MTVLPTSDEYAKSPRWFWAQKMIGTQGEYKRLCAVIFNASLAQP